MTRLSDLLARCATSGGSAVLAEVGDDWMQGRSVFGGLQAAVALAAMRSVVPDVALRTFQMTFVAPVGADALRAQARVLRTGKSATHVEARLETGGETLALAVGVFGTGRPSIVRQDLPTPAPLRATAKLPFVPGIVPNFIQHFDVGLLDGGLPFSNSRVDHTYYELGLRDTGPVSEAHLLAIADFVPPVALSWMPAVVPGSSLTWMLEMLDDDFAAQPLQGWRADATMSAARDGYTSQTTTIYAPDGRAIALSRQSMVVFA
jgi:acyl-CoA thioesterase